MSNNLYTLLIKLLVEKGGARKKSSGAIKFYKEQLMIRDKKTNAEYEIKEINDDDPNNLIFTINRQDTNGDRKESYDYHQKDIIEKFEIV